MTTTISTNFSDRIHRENTQRWIDLSAHGIQLKIAVYGDGSDHVFAEGDPTEVAKLSQLGFTEIGGEMTLQIVEIAPRKFIEIFPNTVMVREMQASKVFADRTEYSSQLERAEALKNESSGPRI